VSGPSLWFTRHGETEWSRAGRHTSRTDIPLTSEGEREALLLGQAVSGTDFDLILSSPQQRALHTAQLAGLAASVDQDLTEWDYGELEGLTLDEIRAIYPGWTIWDGPWPGGETAEQVAARADRVVRRVLDLPEGASALFVSHGHILRVIAACWLRQPARAGRLFSLATATLSVLGWEHGEPAVRCWNIPPSHASALADGLAS